MYIKPIQVLFNCSKLSDQNQDLLTNAVLRLRRGQDEQAMELLYRTYSRSMLTLSYRITNDLQESEDILQESFLQAFSKIRQLREASSFQPWLRRLVVNNSLRSRKKQLYYEEPSLLPNLPDEDTSLWYESMPPELIKQAIQALPAGCRTVFTLYLMEDYKHREIADTLGISLSTSKSQYRYALKFLREKLAPYRSKIHNGAL